jgi:uncharacterized damage-inducible protein DinB
MDPLIETWFIHNRINLYLLESIESEHLSDQASSKGRTVGEQLAHIHNVRLMWIKEAQPELLDQVQKVEKEQIDKALLQTQLEASARAIADMLKQGLENGRIKGFKPHPTAFVGYLISHESHHRGQITLSLKQSAHPISKKVSFGMWEWGTR